MGKEKRLEDVIPADTLNFHLRIYDFLKQIESKSLHDFNKAIDKFSKIDDIIQSFVDDKWITEKEAQSLMNIFREALEKVVFRKYDLDHYLFLKSELETTKININPKTYDITYKRRLTGNKPASYARSYLLVSLCAEIKDITGKPNYEMVADFFERTFKEAGFNARRIEIENKRIKDSGLIIHILETLSTYQPKILQN